jgi:hypothetical protein
MMRCARLLLLLLKAVRAARPIGSDCRFPLFVADGDLYLRVCRILIEMADAVFSSSWRIQKGTVVPNVSPRPSHGAIIDVDDRKALTVAYSKTQSIGGDAVNRGAPRQRQRMGLAFEIPDRQQACQTGRYD